VPSGGFVQSVVMFTTSIAEKIQRITHGKFTLARGVQGIWMSRLITLLCGMECMTLKKNPRKTGNILTKILITVAVFMNLILWNFK